MKLSEEDKDRIINKFRKICVRNWTSREYHIPADSEELAELKAIEVCLFLEEALGNKRS